MNDQATIDEYTLSMERLVVIMSTLLVGAFWLQVLGPLGSFPRWGAFPEPTAYMFQLSAFLCLGLLVSDAYAMWKIDGGISRRSLELSFMIVAMVVISSGRVWLDTPASGHSLLFMYFIVRRLAVGAPSSRHPERELAFMAVLLLPMTYVKIFGWHDPNSFVFGGILGSVLAIVSWIVSRRSVQQIAVGQQG